MFLFQTNTVSKPSSSATTEVVVSSTLKDLLSAQKTLIFEAFKNRSITPEGCRDAVSSSFQAISEFYDSKYVSLNNTQKTDFLAFVSEWKLWANKMMDKGNMTETSRNGANTRATEILANNPELKTGPNAEYQSRLYLHSNFFSVLGMAADYSAKNKFITMPQAEMMASFWGAMEDSGRLSTYKSRQLVIAMIEASAGGDNAADQWTFTFAKAADAAFFKNTILANMQGFQANAEEVNNLTISFSLQQTAAKAGKENEFTAPVDALVKTTPEKDKDGSYRLAKYYKLDFKSEKIGNYTADPEAAFADKAESRSSSAIQGSTDQVQSTAVHYGKGYASDKYLSQAAVDLQMYNNIFNLAKRYGYDVKPPNLGVWLAGEEGQKFLNKISEVGIKLDVTGSADMAVFYDGDRQGWKTAADKNLALAKERSEMAISYLARLSNEIAQNYEKAHNGAKDGLVDLKFSHEVKGKVHFFQDFSTDEAKLLNIGSYGYAQNDGKKNMTALVNYLKTAAKGDPEANVCGTAFSFTEDDKNKAAKYLKILIDNKAIKTDGDNYVAGDLSKLNTYFRRNTDDPSLNGAPGLRDGMIFEGKVPLKPGEATVNPNVFARAIMQSTETSSRSVTISSNVEANLGIEMGEIKNGKAEIAIAYKFNGKDILFNENSGDLHVFFRTAAGVTDLVANRQADGKYVVENIPQGAGRLMAYAETKDGKLNSGYAWQTVKITKPIVQIRRITVGGEVAPQYPGTYMPLPFQAFSLTKTEAKEGEGGSIEQQPINSMLCFGIRTKDKKLNFAPKYLTYPGEVDIKKGVPTYKLGNDYVIVDRDLYYRGPNYKETSKYELYMKQADLEQKAKSGVVALFVQPASGEGVWVRLDGRLVDEKTLNELKDFEANQGATEFLYGTKNTFAAKTVVSFLNNPNASIRADAGKSKEVPNIVSNALGSGGMYESSHMPNAMVVESRSDLWLARQHVIAQVEADPANPSSASVSQLDGKKIGTIDISTTAAPDLAGKNRAEKTSLNAEWEKENALKMAGQIGLLAGGFFLFKPREEQDSFAYPTYIPRFDNIVKVTGYIYSMKDFFDARGAKSED